MFYTIILNSSVVNQDNLYNRFQQINARIQMSEEESLQQLKSHLSLIKSITGDKAEEQFYQLMQKAKTAFGDLSLYMAQFYFEYAKFLLEKLQKNLDIFNAGQLPNNQQQQEAAAIPENMLQQDSQQENSNNKPKSENNINIQNKPESGSQQKNQCNGSPIIETTQTVKQKINLNVQNNDEKIQNAGEDDDFQVCADNLLCAIKIFQTQKDRLKGGGQQAKYSNSQVNQWISRCKSRLGDLYQLGQNYQEAISTYREVIHEQQKKLGHQFNRGIAEIHYLIGNSFLYQNKQGCQKLAIKQYIKSVQILLNYLSTINKQDIANYQVPSQEKTKVDRFSYLPKSTDSEQVKQIKDVISCILDKIEDTHEQISIRKQYEAEKIKTKQEDQSNKFKEVNQSTNVIKLGTFGNRKKKAQQLPDQQITRKDFKGSN